MALEGEEREERLEEGLAGQRLHRTVGLELRLRPSASFQQGGTSPVEEADQVHLGSM